MTLTERAMQHNRPAFLAELKEVAGIRRLHGDRAGALDIEQTIIELDTGATVETDWTSKIARRFVHVS